MYFQMYLTSEKNKHWCNQTFTFQRYDDFQPRSRMWITESDVPYNKKYEDLYFYFVQGQSHMA